MSGFERDEFINDAENAFAEVLEDSFQGQPVILFRNGNLDESAAIHTKAIIDGNTQSNMSAYEHRWIMSYTDSLKVGNYVKFRDDYYIISEVPGNNQIYDKAPMLLCNHKLRWTNENGEIIERYAVYRDHTRHLPGEHANRYIKEGDMRLMIGLPKDSETIKLSRGKRFIVDDYDRAQVVRAPVVLQITKYNAIQRGDENGAYFDFTMMETPYNDDTDNRELMIADYFPTVYGLEIITPTNLEIENGQNAQIQFAAKLNDREAREHVHFMVDDEKVAHIADDGTIQGLTVGETQVRVVFFQEERVINVRVVKSSRVFQDTARISFKGSPTLRVGGTKIFHVAFFDSSGNPTGDTPFWSVVDSSGSAAEFITLENQQDGSVRVRCKNDIRLMGKELTIRTTSASGMVSDSTQITLIGLT